jgi:hypothetical protein
LDPQHLIGELESHSHPHEAHNRISDVVRLAFAEHMTAPKSAPTTFRFQPEVKTALATIAEREGRSMANMIEWLIKKHCEVQKLGWPPDENDSRFHARPHAASRRRG